MLPFPGDRICVLPRRRLGGWLFLLPGLVALSEAAAQESPVTFSASDSLIIDFDADQGRLVGSAAVAYDDISLSAHAVDILFDAEEVRAAGMESDSGMVGAPVFTQGSETLTGISFTYNMATNRGRVVGARTQFEDGFIQAGVAKVREDSSVFIKDGLYTTCDCPPDEVPSYSLRARRMKVVDRKWVYTGPIQLFIFNIPTPIWLPFGFLPYREGRRSGLLAPSYGEDQRGFYLRNWGYYWAASEFIDMQLRLGIWTKGSWQVNPSFRYNRRYLYSGGAGVDYLRERSGEKDDPDLLVRNSISVRWSHNQTLSPTARLTANVNLTSSSYLRTISEQYEDNVRQSVGSSIQYSKRMGGGRSLSINVRQNQILSTGTTDLALPDLTFSQSTKTPFKRGGTSRNPQWYERLQFSLNSRVSNRYSFRPLSDAQLVANGDTLADGTPIDIPWYEALLDQRRYEQATGRTDSRIDFRATHRVPVAVPFAISNLPLLGAFRLNVAPNANYSEEWYVQTARQQADSSGAVTRSTSRGFFSLRQFNTGVSATTTFYGLFPVRFGAYRGVRHTVRPRAGFSYRPDFSSDFWGYSRPLVDGAGNPVPGGDDVLRYDLVPGVQRGLQQAINFGIDNVFETKRVTEDSTGADQSRVLKLFNLNLSSSYNFAADSLKLAPVQISARTNVLGKLNLNLSGSLSPYKLNAEGTRPVDDYAFSLRRGRLARLTRLSIRGDFRLRSRGEVAAPQSPQPGIPAFDDFASSTMGLSDPFASRSYGAGAFADWSLNVSFGYMIARPASELIRRATVNTGFDFNVTSTWRVRGQTGYDFESGELVTSTLNIMKEFECWQMSFRWIPFGSFQSWGFDLHVKSGRLREFLRLQQPRVERDRGLRPRPQGFPI